MQATIQEPTGIVMNPTTKRPGSEDDDSRRLDRLIVDEGHARESAKEAFASIDRQFADLKKDLQETRHTLREEMQSSELRLEVKIAKQDTILQGKDGLIMQMALIEKSVGDLLKMREDIGGDMRYWSRRVICAIGGLLIALGLSWYDRSLHDGEVRSQLHGLTTAVSRNKTDIKAEVQRASDVIESTKAFEP